MNDLIPTFEIGEKVILNYHPYENICSSCHSVYGTYRAPFRKEVVIISQGFTGAKFRCSTCGAELPKSDGFWTTNIISESGRLIAVPYTLLEKITPKD